MRDITAGDIGFRGYPVKLLGDAAYECLVRFSPTVNATIHLLLREMVDTAGPGEPSGWIFEAKLPTGDRFWLERCGGMRTEDRHEGGHWALYLPDER